MKILIKEDMLEFISSERLDEESKIYVVSFKNKICIVKRTGECDYKKCKSACCKFFCIGDRDYAKGFGKQNEFGKAIVDIHCKNLTKCGNCPLFNKKNFPGACKQFPHPSDSTYWHIMDKCSFKFEILYIINKVSKLVIEEMLKNFKE